MEIKNSLKLETKINDLKILVKRGLSNRTPNNYDEMTSKEKIKALSINMPFYFLNEDDYNYYSRRNKGFPLGMCFVLQENGTYNLYNDIPIYLEGEKNPLIKKAIIGEVYLDPQLKPVF